MVLKSYMTEIDPTEEQKHKINRTIGVCRFIYNFYIPENKALKLTGRSKDIG